MNSRITYSPNGTSTSISPSILKLEPVCEMRFVPPVNLLLVINTCLRPVRSGTPNGVNVNAGAAEDIRTPRTRAILFPSSKLYMENVPADMVNRSFCVKGSCVMVIVAGVISASINVWSAEMRVVVVYCPCAIV